MTKRGIEYAHVTALLIWYNRGLEELISLQMNIIFDTGARAIPNFSASAINVVSHWLEHLYMPFISLHRWLDAKLGLRRHRDACVDRLSLRCIFNNKHTFLWNIFAIQYKTLVVHQRLGSGYS